VLHIIYTLYVMFLHIRMQRRDRKRMNVIVYCRGRNYDVCTVRANGATKSNNIKITSPAVLIINERFHARSSTPGTVETISTDMPQYNWT